MKKLLFPLIVILSTYNGTAQVVNDSADSGPNYVNQVYYRLSDGTKTTVSNEDWDLQFTTNTFDVSVRINGGNGVELYLPTNADTSNFLTSTLDTSNATQLYDGHDYWTNSAFTAIATGHPNYGWGEYKGTGVLVGTKVFAIKLANGNYKKIWIQGHSAQGIYTIALADLDGANNTIFTVDRGNYNTKRHVYYDLDAMQTLDLEPAQGDWDFVFRRYYEEIAPNTHYPVTGVLTNTEIRLYEAANTPTADAKANWGSYSLDSVINIMGYDWKSFNMSTFRFDITDSLSYIIQDNAGDIYQVIFTGFGGSATGKYYFSKEKLSTASIGELNGNKIESLVYPNPVQNTLNIEIKNSNDTELFLYDVNGKVVLHKSNLNLLNNIDVSPLNKGIYFVLLTDGEKISQHKVVVQ